VAETLEYVPKSLENGRFTNIGQYVNDSEGPSEKQAPKLIETSIALLTSWGVLLNAYS